MTQKEKLQEILNDLEGVKSKIQNMIGATSEVPAQSTEETTPPTEDRPDRP